MTNLLAASAFFLLIHLAVSGTRLRDEIVNRIGDNAYLGAFSLASVAGLVWMGSAYSDARSSVAWWDPTTATRLVQLGINLLAFLFVVIGVTTRNPTSVRQEGVLASPTVVQGMLRITRHPFLWGIALWAAGHLMVRGNLPNLVFFGAFLFLALLGTSSIDAKRRRALGEAWNDFSAQTSNMPFAAIIAGRQTLKIGEIGLWRVALAVAVWAALAWGHPMLFGARALP